MGQWFLFWFILAKIDSITFYFWKFKRVDNSHEIWHCLLVLGVYVRLCLVVATIVETILFNESVREYFFFFLEGTINLHFQNRILYIRNTLSQTSGEGKSVICILLRRLSIFSFSHLTKYTEWNALSSNTTFGIALFHFVRLLSVVGCWLFSLELKDVCISFFQSKSYRRLFTIFFL